MSLEVQSNCHHQGLQTVFSQLRRIKSIKLSCPEHHAVEVYKSKKEGKDKEMIYLIEGHAKI